MDTLIRCKKDSSRLQQERDYEIDKKLVAVLLELGYFIYQQWGKRLTITNLVRSLTEQMKLNPARPDSAHVKVRAADLRSRGFTDDQIAAIHDHIKDTWGDIVHFRHHDSGHGDHIHININRAFATRKEV